MDTTERERETESEIEREREREKLIIPSVGEDVEQKEFSYFFC